MAEFPLLPIPPPDADRCPPGTGGGSAIRRPSRERQGERLGPVFQRLRNAFTDDREAVALRRDPAGIAPERVFLPTAQGRQQRIHATGAGPPEFIYDPQYAVYRTPF